MPFGVPPGYNFPNLFTPNIIICIPLCYNLHTLELFVYPWNFLSTPWGSSIPGGETLLKSMDGKAFACEKNNALGQNNTRRVFSSAPINFFNIPFQKTCQNSAIFYIKILIITYIALEII